MQCLRSVSRSLLLGQMQLTILSAEILKTKLGAKSNISVSCNISELPNYHCNLVFVESQQDLGPIGFLRFDNRRPLASAMINLKGNDFYDLSSLIKTVPQEVLLSFFILRNIMKMRLSEELCLEKQARLG